MQLGNKSRPLFHPTLVLSIGGEPPTTTRVLFSHQSYSKKTSSANDKLFFSMPNLWRPFPHGILPFWIPFSLECIKVKCVSAAKQQGGGDPHSSTYNFCSCFYAEAIQAHDDHFISIQKHFFHYELATVLYLLVCNNAPWSEMACKG